MGWRTPLGGFRLRFIAGILSLMMVLAACGGDDNGETEASPTPEQAAEPTAVATATPEPEPTATSTPEPTATPTQYVPAPTVAAPLYEPPAPPPAPEPEPTPVPQDSEPEPTEPPPDTDVPDTDVPDEGETEGLLLMSDLTDLPAQENEIGFGFPDEDGYHIVIDNDATGREYWNLAYAEEPFGDVVASADVRFVDGPPGSMACLVIRVTPDVWMTGYILCLSGYGESFADYRYVNADGVYSYEPLVEVGVREGTFPVNEWNTLTIVAYGEELGFLVNDEVIGVALNGAFPTGGASIMVANFEEGIPEWAFTNLQVWQILE